LLRKAKDYCFTTKVPKAQVWAIVKVVTSTCGNTCVINQSHGHWLLSNVLTITITLIVDLQFEMAKMFQVSDGTKALNPFDSKLLLF
jgi:hypothetical protein